MRWKLMVVPALTLFFVVAALSARAQVTYSAEEGKQPFTVGAGVSNFSDDWGYQNPRQIGLTVWVDWRPPLPSVLHGLGIEFEGRTIQWATPSYIPGHRMDTALGGPIYQFRRHKWIRPYVKYLIGIGSIDFPNDTSYSHDTRTVYEPAGGADVRLWNRFSVRGEYNYQYWHEIFGPRDLNPNGFSFGVVYDFGLRSSR
jgi:opacity protein-like surface antigen